MNTGMIKQKRIIFLIGGILLFVGILIAIFSIWANKNTFIYSNLMDNEGKLKAQSLLREQNIPQENIDLLFSLADEFNSVPYNGIVEHGWKEGIIPFFSYDNDDGFAHLESQPENLINCRTAAYILLKDTIAFGKTELTPTEKKDMKSRTRISDADWEHYDLLFADIENSNTDSSEALAEKVLAYWNAAGIAFPNSSIQLIMAYADTQNGIQNFHTGVVIYTDEYIWLLEKIDPIHPYQLACFSNQEQIIDYMKKRVSEVEYAAIFSNDTCLWKK